MITAISKVTDSASEPVTTAELQAFLRIDSQDDATEVTAFITKAREMVEDFTGRALVEQTWKYTASDWPFQTWKGFANVVLLPRSPLRAVTYVKYYPENGGALATFSSANYHVVTDHLPGLVVLIEDGDWPDIAVRPDAVQITFTCGHADAASVPASLKHAVKLLAAHLYERRGAIDKDIASVPLQLQHLLDSHRVEGWCA